MNVHAFTQTVPKGPQWSVVIQGVEYVWNESWDPASLAVRTQHAMIQKVIDCITWGIMIFVILAWLVPLVSILIHTGISRTLFQTNTGHFFEPSGIGFFLSFSGLIGCFFFYRLVSRKQIHTTLPHQDDPHSTCAVQEPKGKSFVSITSFFDQAAHKAIQDAFELAARFGHAQVEPIHLLIGTLSSQSVSVLFARWGVEFETIKDMLHRRLASRIPGTQAFFSSETERIVLRAFVNAYRQDRQQVSVLEFFAECYEADSFWKEVLFDCTIDETTFWNTVEWMRMTEKMRERYETFQRLALFKPTGPMNRAMTSMATPTLDAYATDLTQEAVQGSLPLLIGREQEMEDLLRVIEGGHQSVLLVGPDGVGKTAIILGLAQRMVEERVPKILQDKRLVSLSLPFLISGASPTQSQERLMQLLGEVARAGNIILVLEDLEYLQEAQENQALSSLLVDFLSRGFTFAIATTKPRAYTQTVETSDFSRVFQPLVVEEPDQTNAIHILESKMPFIEYEKNVVFTYEAVAKAVELTDRYLHESYLPKKAIEVSEEAALAILHQKGKEGFVTGEDVAAVVASKTGIPLTQVAAKEKDILIHLEEEMHKRMVGQEEAVHAVASALRRARTQLRSQNRPIATFLFLGPTGVGKTELVKTIAATYFGSEKRLVRFDMSEYQEKNSVDRLIGSPASGQGGLLTEAVRKQPYAIVLLDELEKAHPDMVNLFLQVFEDGRLTDASGRTIDFTNTIIVATSNAGTSYIQDAMRAGESLEQIKTRLLEEELRAMYRPEFLNRCDGIIVFRPLQKEEIRHIASLMISQVTARLEPKGIGFRVEDAMLDALVQKGFDPQFGARPLRRVIQEEVENAIADILLQGKVKRRDTIVLEEGGTIYIESAPTL